MKAEITNPVKAIRAFCLECVETYNDVKECPAKECPLYPFRLGRNPYRTKREMTEEQRSAAAERLALAREKKAEWQKEGDINNA